MQTSYIENLNPTAPLNTGAIDPESLAYLRALIQEGLPLVERPYLSLAQQTGLTEQQVLDQLDVWQTEKLIRRFGIVINHHKIGYTSNAMVVWQIPPSDVDKVGKAISATGLVSLCYQRRACGDFWPYNLYCMLHGKNREEVLQRLQQLKQQCGLSDIPSRILFSLKQFKQCGGKYTFAQIDREKEATCTLHS
ncbi:AsnC family protein [Hahella sp. CCB-MM4]|uniref:siroheme decarboxylase subunit beta n=1 Tax=Hahella sp. (strain CCB-MM4) TaxID=1926491 RepID=UPI000BC59957|nr:Lrp/AsnC family transcriptional regulator [Hahella sp. CCB-MM4]OZG72975.1 AsnC family protein [Hahella sp. CCB-MM4]